MGLLDAALPLISTEEWTTLKELCQILEPFADATNCVSGENYMSASLVIVLTGGLINVCKNLSTANFNEVSRDIISSLQNGLRSRLGNVEYNNTLAISTFLDPRFKTFAFKNSDAVDIKNFIIDALGELITQSQNQSEIHESEPEPSTSAASNDSLVPEIATRDHLKVRYSLWDSLDRSVSQFKPKATASSRAIIEVQRYLEDEALSRNQNPLAWWKNNKHNDPYLSQLVRSKCCALATSVPCERLLSKAGIILDDCRRRLSTNKLKQLLFININK